METTVSIKEKLYSRICRILTASNPKQVAGEAVNFVIKLSAYYANEYNNGVYLEKDPIRELYPFLERDKSLITLVSQMLAWGLAVKKVHNLGDSELPRGIDFNNDKDEIVRICAQVYSYVLNEDFPKYLFEPPIRRWNLSTSVLRLESYISRKCLEIESKKVVALESENKVLKEQLSSYRKYTFFGIGFTL